MYGKHFESMYDGSMYGAGIAVFAVWGYVIAHTRRSRVELNPRKLSDTLGGTQEEIVAAIEFLMAPDPNSRHKEREGRRLIKEGEFQYFVPAWEDYQTIRNEDGRREYNRLAQQRSRQKKAKKYGPTERERQFDEAYGDGDLSAADGFTDAMHDGPPAKPPPDTRPLTVRGN